MSQWSLKASRSLSVVAVAALIFVATAPSTPAEETPEFDPALVDFHITDEALTLETPDSDETKSASMISNPITPAVSWRVEWGGMSLDGPVRFETATVATLWVEPEEANVINQVRASILSGGERVAIGDVEIIGTSGESVWNEARKIQIGIPTQGLEIDGDITLEFGVWGTGASDTPKDIHLLYGSTTHPSRLSAGVSQDSLEHLAPSGFARTYYLDDESLTAEPPTEEESRTRSHSETGLANLATSAGFEWGAITVEEDLELIGDTTLTFWLTHSGDPAVARTIRPEIHIGDTTVTQTAGIDAWTFVDGETYRFDLAFDTTGMEIPAGTQIQVDFIVWSSNSDEVGLIDYLYGSTEHPAGITLRATGIPPSAGTGLPVLNLTAPETELDLPPGNETTVAVTVENPELANATIDWNVSTDADSPVTVELPDGESLALDAEETHEVPVTFRLSEDAFFGSDYAVNLTAQIDGETVGWLNFTVQVVSGGDGGDDGNGAGAVDQNETQENGADPEESGFLPGPGIAAMLLVALLGGVWARHVRGRR